MNSSRSFDQKSYYRSVEIRKRENIESKLLMLEIIERYIGNVKWTNYLDGAVDRQNGGDGKGEKNVMGFFLKMHLLAKMF